MTRLIPPGSKIGIVGGGQLGMLTILAGASMGYEFVVLDPDPDCPSSLITHDQIVAPFDDLKAIQKLGEATDLQICEFENADLEGLRLLEEHYYFPQTAALFELARSRLREKKLADSLAIPVAPYASVSNPDDLIRALKKNIQLPAFFKTNELGYDGKGQRLLNHSCNAESIFSELPMGEYIVEELIELKHEISIIIAKSESEIRYFDLIENFHQYNILHHSKIPSSITEDLKKQIKTYAALFAEMLSFRGLLTLEFFIDQEDKIFFNEMAPRPHNSGHLTIEACHTSQYEQFIRATCNLPLGNISLHTPCKMTNILGQSLSEIDLDNIKNSKFYWYGKKEARPGRKMGHWVSNMLD
ncbi:MAG: 5-(carboxyamino)imidazole ribonucleotide synthase [Candidatus Caenarcaniphilales bacterium]|nr:5-(carboxyamino)imidazole ribonucleotide synthase [Candidatus Caenarcaniphilales bacterium]